MTTPVQPFPDVDEDRIRLAAREVSGVVDHLVSARQRLAAVGASDSWRSPSAKPSWDAALEQRATDLGAAREVTAHLHDVLTTTASRLSAYRDEYDAALLQVQLMGDPTRPFDPTLGGLLPGAQTDPHDPVLVAAYEDLVRRCNDIVDDAQVCLALCATEMLAMATGAAFAAPDLPLDDWS